MNRPSTEQLIAWDRQYVWHPFTPMKPWCEEKDPLVIARGERKFLFDTEGRRFIDGTSSIWCNVHGHCVPELDAALKMQIDQVAHSTLLGMANVPSVLLARRLVELARGCGLALEKVFFSDNGSTAVEVACKMAFQYWKNLKTPRFRFIAFGNAYHGDTLGAVSLGGIPLFHQAFQGLTFPVDFIPAPHPDPAATLAALESLLRDHPLEHAAIVIEPLVLGAGGMLMYPAEVLCQIDALARKYDTLLIFDEVLTGFGRTGKMFAAEHAHPVTPDLMCLSKGLTAGYMPLGVTLATQKIFDAFYADPREGKTFYHGHTFTGHPLACAVALASLDLFDSTHLLDHVQRMSAILAETLAAARGKPFVFDARQCGLIGAIELRARDGSPFPYHWRIGGAICRAMRDAQPIGLIMRPLADNIIIMPPLAITEQNMRYLCQSVLQSLDLVKVVVAAKSSPRADLSQSQ